MDLSSVPVQVFVVCLVTGLLLMGAEIFVPGGVLGVIGGLALLAAVAAGFSAYGPTVGGYIALGVVVLVGVALFLWIKLFPGSRVGRKMTVSLDLADAKATELDVERLLGKEGVTTSELRPSGYAMFGDRRVDVITRGEMIDPRTRVRVIEIEGNRIVVEAVADSAPPNPAN